jgi:DNA recombination protein RmuC
LDQALMFIPSEAIYYDLLANKVGVGNVSGRNMMQYAVEKKVTVVSKHLVAHNGYMLKLGNSLGTTVGHYNNTYKELGKIDRDIVKITDSKANVEPKLLEKPQLDD